MQIDIFLTTPIVVFNFSIDNVPLNSVGTYLLTTYCFASPASTVHQLAAQLPMPYFFLLPTSQRWTSCWECRVPCGGGFYSVSTNAQTKCIE